MMTTAIEVSTSEYRFSCGKEPCGWGHWGFFFDDAQNVDDVFWYTGKFSDARKAAVAWAVTKGHQLVRVAS